jgi:hypothetical protein
MNQLTSNAQSRQDLVGNTGFHMYYLAGFGWNKPEHGTNRIVPVVVSLLVLTSLVFSITHVAAADQQTQAAAITNIVLLSLLTILIVAIRVRHQR